MEQLHTIAKYKDVKYDQDNNYLILSDNSSDSSSSISAALVKLLYIFIMF